MPLPITFANLPTGNNPASTLDQNFAAVGAMGTTYCAASGSNAVLLTVQPNQPTPTGYVNGQRFNFIVAANNTGPVTIQVGSLAAIPLHFGGQQLNANALINSTICEAVVSGNGTQADIVATGGNLSLGGGAVSGSLTVGGANPVIQLIKTGSGGSNLIEGTAGPSIARWTMELGDATPEGGSNTGSNFALDRYTDTGSFIDQPITISRQTGWVSVNNAAATAVLNLNKVANSVGNQLMGTRSANNRWIISPGDANAESSGNIGSDCSFFSYTDAGAFLATPLTIKRSTGVATFSVAIVNGPSDRTLKENIEPIGDALAKVKALQGVSFNMKATPERREIGLIAQDVEAVIPEVIQQFATSDDKGEQRDPKLAPLLALDYPKLVAVLIEAIKTLTARVEALEAR